MCGVVWYGSVMASCSVLTMYFLCLNPPFCTARPLSVAVGTHIHLSAHFYCMLHIVRSTCPAKNVVLG